MARYKGRVFGKPDQEGCWKSNWSSPSDCEGCYALESIGKKYCYWKVIFLAKSGKKEDVSTLADCPMNRWYSGYEW